MKNRKRFCALKKKLHERGFNSYKYLSEVLGWSQSSIGGKMAGSTKWEATDLYELMNLIGEPLHKIPYYFPAEDLDLDIDVSFVMLDEEAEHLKSKEAKLYELAELIQDRLTELEEVI